MKYYIDVREKVEFLLGHVDGAINIPLSKIGTDKNALPANITLDDELIVYCRSGGRAASAAEMLKGYGFKNVFNGINQSTIESSQSK
jgi:phage shock protein E